MGNDDCGGSVSYRRIEDFSGMHHTLVEGTDTDDMRINDSAGTIEGKSEKVLFVLMAILPKIIVNSCGIGDNGIVFDAVVAGTLFPYATVTTSVSVMLHLCRLQLWCFDISDAFGNIPQSLIDFDIFMDRSNLTRGKASARLFVGA